MKATVKRDAERGMTLIMALIMLVVLTLLALTSFNLGKSNLQIVSNMQQRDEAVAAAHAVIEEAISTTAFIDTPNKILSTSCGEANSACVDTNSDGRDDVKVVLPAPTCVKVAPIKQVTDDLETEEGQNCSLGQPQVYGVDGAVTGNSACANSVWDLHAIATEIDTGARVEVVQGIALRAASDETTTACTTP